MFDLFVSISGDNSGFKKSIKDSQSDLTGFEKAAEYSTGKIGDAFASLGLKMSAAGIGAFFLKAGADMQSASNQIAKATGETGKALDSLNSSFKTLYAGSARSGEEIAGGLAKISVETKLSGKALEDLTAANLRFAKVTSSDVAGAVEQTQTVFKQFNIAAADQSDALDVLYATMTATGIGMGSLTGQMAAMGPIARSFGLSFTQTAALVGTFEEAGLQASEVVGGLERAFSKWAAAHKDPIEALSTLIRRMKDAATSADAVALAVEAGLVRGVGVKMADAARRGALDFEALNKKLTESKGKVKEVADNTSSLTDELKKLGHEAALFGETFGTPIIKALTGVVKGFRDANEELVKFQTGIKGSPVPAFLGATMSWGLSSIGNVLNNSLNPLASGNYLNNFFNPGTPSAPGGPKFVAPSLFTPTEGGGGGGGGIDPKAIKDAFSALGLKDLNKDLADSIAAFKLLAGAGLLTHDQMIKAAGAIQKLRDQIAEARHVDLVGISPSGPSLDVLKNLPAGEGQYRFDSHWGASLFEGPSVGTLAALPVYSHGIDLINDSLAAMANETALNARNAGYLTDAFHAFGKQTPEELEAVARDAEDAYSAMRESGKASADDIQDAWRAMFKAQIDAQRAAGKITKQEYEELSKEADTSFGKLSRDAAQTIRQLSNGIAHTLGGALRDIVTRTKTVAQAFKSMGLAIADVLLGVVEKAFAKMLEGWITNLLVGKATTSTVDSAEVTGQAGIAGAAGFASVMASVPFPFNVALAPEVAAASSAAVLGSFLPLAMFARGGDVYDDTPGFFNKREMVLPEDIAVPLRRSLKTQGGITGGGVHVTGNFYGVTRETVNTLATQIVRQARLAGARI